MKCLKCGAEIEDNSKFCGYCGNVVEQPAVNVAPQVQPAVNEVPQAQVEPMVNEVHQTPVVNEIPEAPVQPTAPVEPQPVVNAVPQVQPVITEEPVSKGKKKGGLIAVIIICILLVAAAAVFLVMSMGNRKNSESSVDVLEKAIENMVVNDSSSISKSGTVAAKLLVSDGGENSLTLQANLKYQKLTESTDIELSVPSNPLISEHVDGDIVLYALYKDNSLGLYTKSNIVDSMVEVETENVVWLKYIVENLNFDEIVEELSSEESNSGSTMDVDLSSLIPDKKFVLVGTENKVRHYRLVIDNELLQGMKAKAKELEKKATAEQKEVIDQYTQSLDTIEIKDTYNIDFYINDKDIITKIEFDFSKLLETDEISKAVLSIEFTDLNNTVVTIPSDALNTSVDFETYMQELMNAEVEEEEDEPFEL